MALQSLFPKNGSRTGDTTVGPANALYRFTNGMICLEVRPDNIQLACPKELVTFMEVLAILSGNSLGLLKVERIAKINAFMHYIKRNLHAHGREEAIVIYGDRRDLAELHRFMEQFHYRLPAEPHANSYVGRKNSR